MTGDVDFCVYDGHTRFDIHLHRNVTVIQGNGATGKTTLCQMIMRSKMGGAKLKISAEDKSRPIDIAVLSDNTMAGGGPGLPLRTNMIYVSDELDTHFTRDVARFVRDSGAYFIFISRMHIPDIPYSIHEIYEMTSHRETDGKQVFTLSRLFAKSHFGELPTSREFITEDI